MPAKTPVNHSLSWEALAAASPLAVLWALVTNFSPGTLDIIPGPRMLAGYTMLAGSGMGALFMAHDYISSFPARRLKVAFETCKLYVHKEAGIRLPKLIAKRTKRYDWGWWFYYSLPIGLCKSDFDQEREPIEAALDSEVNFAWQDGYLRVEVAKGEMPKKIAYKLPEDLEGEIPFIVGVGRTGLIVACLTKLPHLLLGGTTGAGKSNMLHTIVATILLLRPEVHLHIIDLKMVEFSYLRDKIASTAYTLHGAIKVLEKLTGEMERRKAFLSGQGYVSAVEWRRDHPDELEKLPYHVVVVDEFSQLSPILSKEKEDRDVRNYANRMLVDLVCLARSLGIHVIVATQYPTAELIHNQLKANLNGVIAFKCKTEGNSRVCLDNDKAAHLPNIKDVKGRAIWQFDEEREVQTMYLPMATAKSLTAGAQAQVQEKEKPMQPGKVRREGIEYD